MAFEYEKGDTVFASRGGYDYMGDVIAIGYLGGFSEKCVIIEATHYRSATRFGWNPVLHIKNRVFPLESSKLIKYVKGIEVFDLPDKYKGYIPS